MAARLTALAAGTALLVSGCFSDYDPGGPIAARAAEIVADRRAQPISGYCASACTMRLVRDCVEPGARLLFHGPQTDDPLLFDYYSEMMARHYSPDLAEWFLETGRYGTTTFGGGDLIGKGWARPC